MLEWMSNSLMLREFTRSDYNISFYSATYRYQEYLFKLDQVFKDEFTPYISESLNKQSAIR
jgi:hypothetical protein